MSIPTANTPSTLASSILSSLPITVSTTLTASGPNPSRSDDLYEAYLFAVVLRAASSNGYKIEVRDPGGAVASQLRLRRSPGRLGSPSATGQPFTHALLSTPNRPDLELHNGIRVVGKSRVLHEADVLLIPATDAERCRSASVDPPSHCAHLVIEAKYYTQPVKLSTGREFLGLRKDLSAKNMVFVSTIADPSATALLAGTPSVEYDDGVLPGLPGERSFEGFVTRLLRDYRTRR